MTEQEKRQRDIDALRKSILDRWRDFAATQNVKEQAVIRKAIETLAADLENLLAEQERLSKPK